MASKSPTLMLTTPYANLTYAWLHKPEPKYGYYQLTLVFKPDDVFTPSDLGLPGTEPINSIEFMLVLIDYLNREIPSHSSSSCFYFEIKDQTMI